MRALGQTHFRQQFFRQFLGLFFIRPAYALRPEHDVFQRRQMREQIELLKYHPGFLAD